MTQALAKLSESVSSVATEAGNLATQTREFADDVEAAQNAIRDLCDRVSPSGFLDGLRAVFSGDALDEIKEIAEDVQTVLENFGRQAEGRIDLMQTLVQMLDDAVVSMQQRARREFTHYLGDDVGGAVATAFEFQTNSGEGFIKAGLESIISIQQLDPARFAYDFDGATASWSALADTAKYANPATAMMDPLGTFEHGKDTLKGIVHAEDWRADRPGLGLGGLGFEAAGAVTGLGAAKTAARGATAGADAGELGPAVRAAADAGGAAPIAGRASQITDNLNELADDIPTTPAASGPSGPGVPPSLTEPHVPAPQGVPDSPVPQGVPDSPPPRGVPEPSPHAIPDAPTPHTSEPPPPRGTPESPGPHTVSDSPAPHMSEPTKVESAPAPHTSAPVQTERIPATVGAPETAARADNAPSMTQAPGGGGSDASAPRIPPPDGSAIQFDGRQCARRTSAPRNSAARIRPTDARTTNVGRIASLIADAPRKPDSGATSTPQPGGSAWVWWPSRRRTYRIKRP